MNIDTIGQCLGLLWMLISLPNSEASNHTDYKQPDVEAERGLERIYGVCVGAGLACMFLVMLCISYTYYRQKADDKVLEEEPKRTEIKKSMTTLNTEMEKKFKQQLEVKSPPLKQLEVKDLQVEAATQDTRF